MVVDYVDGVSSFEPMFTHTKVTRRTDGSTTFQDAREVCDFILKSDNRHHAHYRGMFAGWDNSPRRGTASNIFTDMTPKLFGDTIRKDILNSGEFYFINAWNEWGEQAVLEPDDLYGYEYLEKLSVAVNPKIY